MRKRLSLVVQVVFYFVAGVNHFINPEFYLPLIPDYLPIPNLINVSAGIIELGLAFGLLFPRTRNFAVMCLILMLIAFIPSHVYFIQVGGCVEGGLCAPLWVGWVRLIIIHPLLIWWIWSVRR